MGLKKILKKVGKGAKKVAPLVIAGLAAKALAGRRKGGQEGDIGIGLRAPRVDDYNYTPRIADHPSNMISSEHGSPPMTWRRRINKAIGTNFKKGGRVTGIAKRGFGIALMKSKK